MEDIKTLEQGFDDPARQIIKRGVIHFTDDPEMQGFTEVKVSKYDNLYGATWANLVKEYLKSAYLADSSHAEVVAWGVNYKVLRRDNVTVFYDAEGNTLFDVENKRLDKEYQWLDKNAENTNTQQEINNCTIMKEIKNTKMKCSGVGEEKCDECPKIEPALADMHKDKAGSEADLEHAGEEEAAAAIEENSKPFQIKAKEKLEEELKNAKDKAFAEPVIGYLLKRCEEDEGLSQDVMQKHKTWDKCFAYIYSNARTQTKGESAHICDEVVFEWAEDYYHMDDKALAEQQTGERKEAAGKKAVQKEKAEKSKPDKGFEDSATKKLKTEARTDAEAKVKANAKVKSQDKVMESEPKTAPAEKPKKNNKDMDGQMDLFSFMGL